MSRVCAKALSPAVGQRYRINLCGLKIGEMVKSLFLDLGLLPQFWWDDFRYSGKVNAVYGGILFNF
jgi:hypothetical protein